MSVIALRGGGRSGPLFLGSDEPPCLQAGRERCYLLASISEHSSFGVDRSVYDDGERGENNVIIKTVLILVGAGDSQRVSKRCPLTGTKSPPL